MATEDRKLTDLKQDVGLLTQNAQRLEVEQKDLESVIEQSKTALGTLEKDTEQQIRQLKADAHKTKDELNTTIRESEHQIGHNKNELKKLKKNLENKEHELTAIQQEVHDALRGQR